MIEIWPVDADAAGATPSAPTLTQTTAARTTASSPAVRPQVLRNYFTVTFTVRL